MIATATMTPDTFRTLSTTDWFKTVRTPYTDEQMLALLRASDAPFAKSLVGKLGQYGRLTQNQTVWAHDLVLRNNATPAEPVAIGNFEPIMALFTNAKSRLKYPKVVFDFEDTPICLHVCGPRSRHPGAISVGDGKKYSDPSRKWYGWIKPDGALVPSRYCTEDVIAFLKAFAADPAGMVANYGKSEGRCCFCRKALTDARSTAAGFGPVCAKSWGLWSQWVSAGGGATSEELSADVVVDTKPEGE